MDLSKLEQQIAKTGFVLENAIAQYLKKEGWTVISNRYYVDDLEGSVREIDLVAYRVTKVQRFNVFTSLIISCKKSDANAWTLLSRKIDLDDPNSDWWPLHAWTNDKALEYQLRRLGMRKKYHKDLNKLGVNEALQTPNVEVFAFQEMARNSGAPQNDKAIFSSITSLMKAQSYELTALPLRRKDAAIYQFNLLSVVDADLIRLKFSGSKIIAEPIESEHYIARYIVQKKETFARIRFIQADAFKKCLADYNRLHDANCGWFSDQCNSFYKDIVTDWSRLKVLLDDFRNHLGIPFRLRVKKKEPIELTDISIDWREEKKSVAVMAPFSSPTIKFLERDEEALRRAKKALKDVYRYEGPFFFDSDEIPF